MANRLSALRYLFNARTCILLKYWLILHYIHDFPHERYQLWNPTNS